MAPTAPYDSAAEASSAPIGADEAEEFVPPVALSPEARATCDSMAAAWQPVPGVRLTTVDKIVQLGGGDIIGFRGADDDKPWVRACVVEAYVAQDEGSVGHVRRVYRGAGWVELVRISADGPEGGSTTHQGGRTRCHLLRRVPFGDGPEDTTRLAPFYLERATCWTHWSDVAPADTANGFPS